jgi:biotin operon repressor
MDIDASLQATKALADRSRLLILNSLLSGPRCVEEIASTLGLAPSTVSFHLKKLVAAGLVSARREQYYAVYAVSSELLDLKIGDLIGFRNPDEDRQLRRGRDESQRVLDSYFERGRLVRMPAQSRKRNLVVEQFAGLFEPGKDYAEREVNEAITKAFEDYCLVRRLLVDQGYFTRSKGLYTRTEKPPAGALRNPLIPSNSGGAEMEQGHKKLKDDYKQTQKRAGIFKVTNLANGRVFLGSALNLHGPLNKIEFELRYGCYRNQELQEDFNKFGRDSFKFEIVEEVKPSSDPGFSVERELERLEEAYAKDLDRSACYNTTDDIRFIARRR